MSNNTLTAGRTGGLLALVLLVDASWALTFLVALPALAGQDTAVHQGIAGFTLAAFGIAKLSVQSFSGMLADRFSPARAARVGVVLCLAAAAGLAASTNPALFPVFGAVYGAGSAVLWPALYAEAAAGSEGGGRSRLVALLAITTGVAVGVAVLGGSFLVDFVSSHAGFVVATAALCVALTVAALLRGDGTRAAHIVRAASAPARETRQAVTAGQRCLVGGLVLMQAAGVAALVPVIGPFATSQLGIDFHVAVLYLAPAAAAALAGLLTGTRLSGQFGRTTVAAGGLAIAGAGALVLAASEAPALASGGAAILALGYGAAFPAVSATMMDFAGTRFRGTVIGWFMTAEGCGHALGPAAAGLALGLAGAQVVVFGAALTLAVAAALAGTLAVSVRGIAGIASPAARGLGPAGAVE